MSAIFKRSNSPYYWYSTRYKRRRIRKSTKMTNKKMAKKVQEYWDSKLIKGELDFLGLNMASRMTIKQYFLKYLIFISSRKSETTVNIAKGILKKFHLYLDELNIIKLDEIKVSTINGYIDWLNCAPKTKKNHINTISLMLKQAINEDLIKTNPTKKATLPIITQVRPNRPFTQEDIQIIFRDAGSWDLYFLYLYYTGLRAGDAAMLTHGNIDRTKKIITNFVRKSRRIHEFPLADALDEATPHLQDKTPLFPSLFAKKELSTGERVTNEKRLHHNLAKPRKYIQAILKAAQRPHANLHSFRVTYNNVLLNIGVSIQDRQVLLAHSATSTTKIYTHPNIELARSYVNQIANPLSITENN